MIEIQTIGRYYTEHRLKALILPEKLLIHDLLNLSHEGIENSTSEEYELFLDRLRSDKEFREL